MASDVSGRKEMFYLTTHSKHFIYGYMASDIWLRTILTCIMFSKNGTGISVAI